MCPRKDFSSRSRARRRFGVSLAFQLLADQLANPRPALLQQQLAAVFVEAGGLGGRLAEEPLAGGGDVPAGVVDVQGLTSPGQRPTGRLPDPRGPVAEHVQPSRRSRACHDRRNRLVAEMSAHITRAVASGNSRDSHSAAVAGWALGRFWATPIFRSRQPFSRVLTLPASPANSQPPLGLAEALGGGLLRPLPAG